MIPALSLVSAAALSRYDEDGEPLLTPSERILLALRWFDWAHLADLMDGLDVSPDDRNRYAKAIGRLVDSGRVERDGWLFRLGVVRTPVSITDAERLRRKREAVQRWKQANRAAGRCVECAQPATSGVLCARHRQKQQAKDAARRAA